MLGFSYLFYFVFSRQPEDIVELFTGIKKKKNTHTHTHTHTHSLFPSLDLFIVLIARFWDKSIDYFIVSL